MAHVQTHTRAFDLHKQSKGTWTGRDPGELLRSIGTHEGSSLSGWLDECMDEEEEEESDSDA